MTGPSAAAASAARPVPHRRRASCRAPRPPGVAGWSNSRTWLARIQTASGSRSSGQRGQVGPAGVAEVAEPLVGGVPGGELGLEDGEDVVADHLRRARPRAGAPRAGRRRSQRHVVVVEPADDRAAAGPLAGAAAVEPEAARVGGRDLPEVRGRVGVRAHAAAPGSSRPARRRARTGSTRGGTARPRAAATGAAPPSRPVRRPRAGGGDLEAVGHLDRGQRVVADRAEVLRHAGEDAGAVVVDLGRPRRGPGASRSTRAAVRRDEALHARGRRRAPAGWPAAAPRGRPRSRPGPPGARGRARARRGSGGARRRRPPRRAARPRGSTPVTEATRWTRFHV